MNDDSKVRLETEMLRRLKKVINSKNTRLTVGSVRCDSTEPWDCKEVTGRIYLENYEESYSMEFKLRNRISVEALRNAEIEFKVGDL